MSDGRELAPPPVEIGPGRVLARARGERKLSVSDVAQRLKYSVRQIEALEAEEFGKLPGTTFVRGMTRGYAKLLEIDPRPLLKALEGQNVPAEITVGPRAKRIPFPEGGKRGTRVYLVLSLLVLVAVLAVLYEWQGGTLPRPEQVTGSAAVPQPVKPDIRVEESLPTPKADATAAPGAVPVAPAVVSVEALPENTQLKPPQLKPHRIGDLRRIQLEFERESWVEIKDKGGKTLLSQLNSGGTQQLVEGRPPFSLIIGNAAAVRLTYEDAPVDLKPFVKIEVARLTLD